MPHEQIFIVFVESYYTCCDIIVIVNCEKAEINAVENSNMY